MKEKFSALIDGELAREELAQVCSGLDDPEVRADWADFALIGAALRREGQLDFDVSGRVMAALADEPTVLAPRTVEPAAIDVAGRHRVAQNHRWSALAASVAGVSLVAWVAMTAAPPEPAIEVAAVTAPAHSETALASGAPAPANQALLAQKLATSNTALPEFQDYLVAHQAHVSGGAISGGSRNVRAVSLSRDGR